MAVTAGTATLKVTEGRGERWKTISRNATRCCVAFLMGIFLCPRALLAGVLGLPGKREGAGLAVDLVRWNGGVTLNIS